MATALVARIMIDRKSRIGHMTKVILSPSSDKEIEGIKLESVTFEWQSSSIELLSASSQRQCHWYKLCLLRSEMTAKYF